MIDSNSHIVNSNKTNHNVQFYIVRLFPNSNIFILKSRLTNQLLNYTLSDLILDFDIIQKMHPLQTCYLGIKCAIIGKNIIANSSDKLKASNPTNSNTEVCATCFKYKLYSQLRGSKISFIDQVTGERIIMPVSDVINAHELLQEFNSIEALRIGIIYANQILNRNSAVISC